MLKIQSGEIHMIWGTNWKFETQQFYESSHGSSRFNDSNFAEVLLIQIHLQITLHFKLNQFYCYAQKMITVVIETFARCQLYRLLWPEYLL